MARNRWLCGRTFRPTVLMRQLETRPVWGAGVAGILITDPRLAQRYRLRQGAVGAMERAHVGSLAVW